MTIDPAGGLLGRMRTLWMVVVVVLIAGCKHAPKVFVPNTPEGNTCKRECMNVRASCDSSGNRRDRKELCPKRELDCLLTCPGAVAGDGRTAEDIDPVQPPPPPAQPVLAPGASCIASELPEWQGASAAEKKQLMEKCRAPAQ